MLDNKECVMYKVSYYLLGLPFGTEISLKNAVEKAYEDDGCAWVYVDGKGFVFSADKGETHLIIEDDLFDILPMVEKDLKREDRILDFSKYDDQVVGLPYNIPFVIRQKIMPKVFCPKCESEHTAPIIYGYPTPIAFKRAEMGEFFLGGCMVGGIDPDYKCHDCGYSWSKEMLPSTAIKKVRYKVSSNGLCTIDDTKQWVYEVYPDGKCKYYLYLGKSRKAFEKEETTISTNRVATLYRDLQKLVKKYPDELIVGYVDDGCSFELQITYNDNRKEIFEGDVGGGDYDKVMEAFVHKVFKV